MAKLNAFHRFYVMLILLWILGCSSPAQNTPTFQPPPLPKSMQKCTSYNDEKIFAYCIYQQAASLYEVAEVQKYCPLSKDWEEACRHAWSVRRVQSWRQEPIEELLEGCGGFSDCAFEFIDTRPSRDTQIQLARCRKYVQADRDDCMMHAMQMWANSKPTQAQVREFIEKEQPLSHVEIKYISEYVYCSEWDLCTGEGANKTRCQKSIRKLQKRKHRCRTNWGKMPPK